MIGDNLFRIANDRIHYLYTNIQRSQEQKQIKTASTERQRIDFTRPSSGKRLIQKSEHPQRYFVAVADLDVIYSQIAVGLVLYLIEALVPAAYFKEQITSYTPLILEKGLAQRTLIDTLAEGIHEVGILKIYLVGPRKIAVVFRLI